MRNLKRITTLSAIGALLCVGAMGVEASNAQRTVTVTINRVAQMDRLDNPLLFVGDRPDFYAEIWINGQYHKTANMGKPFGWTFSVPVTTDIANIRIRLMEDDGGLEGVDDHVDINPLPNQKDLDITFDCSKGSISSTPFEMMADGLYSQGGGDSERGKIWFTIS
jgi:hypothetical protein